MPKRSLNKAQKPDSMKFLLDESAEFRISTFLKEQKHDVTAIAYDYPQSLPGQQVLAIARREQRILITNDRDFGELIFREKILHTGVIYFRLGLTSTAQDKMTWLSRLLITHRDKLREFIVVDRRGPRIAQRKT